jgi:hypothetical protein
MFFTDFIKSAQLSNLMKIRPVGDELFHTDGRTDETHLIIAFHNFANKTNKDITTANFLSKQTGNFNCTLPNEI